MLINGWKWRDAIVFEEENDKGQEPPPEKEEEFDKERALETIRKLREFEKESKRLKKQLDDINAAEQQRKDKDLSELDQLRKKFEESERRTQELSQRQRDSAIRHAVEMAAANSRFHDPQDAYRQADLSGVEVDDQGEVSGVDAAIKALVTKKPYLIKPEAGGGDINAREKGRSGDATTKSAAQAVLDRAYAKPKERQ